MCDTKSIQGAPQEQQCSLIVRVVSSVLDKLICGHVDSPRRSSCGGGFLKFQSSYAPEVTIEAYLDRIRRYSRCSDACFVMALVYVDRLIETRGLILTKLNAHRLLITSVMLAAKFHDDLFYNNAYYSKLGGLSLTELNHLEAELLLQLDFSLFVHESAYGKYSAQLQNYVFYLEVMPSVGSAPAVNTVPSQGMTDTSPVGQTSIYAYPPAQCMANAGFTAHPPKPALVPPVPVAAGLALVSSSCLHSSAYCGYDGGAAAPVGWVRVPSPDNPHAKANSFSDHYLTASSPLRIAPPRQPSAAAFQQQHQQLQAQVQASLLAQQQQQQQQQQRYLASYAAAELETETQLQSMSPMVYPSVALDASLARSLSSGYFQQSYGGAGGGSMRDSYDDSSATTCSTRTTSPYPSTTALAGTRSLSAGTLGYVASIQAQGTSTFPQSGQSWGNGESSNGKGCTTPPNSSVAFPRRDLTIQTDVGCMEGGGYPLYRSDSTASNGSATTPYQLYEQPPLLRQVSYPSFRPQTSPYPYVAEDHRSHLYAGAAQRSTSSGVGYHGQSQSPLGYGSAAYPSMQPSPSVYAQYHQPLHAQQQAEYEAALAGRYAQSTAAPGGACWRGAGYGAGSTGTTHMQPSRVVTPQGTPSQAYHQQLQPQQGQQVRGSHSEDWSAPYNQHRYHSGGAMMSAGHCLA